MEFVDSANHDDDDEEMEIDLAQEENVDQEDNRPQLAQPGNFRECLPSDERIVEEMHCQEC